MGWLERGGESIFFFLSFVTWCLNEDFFKRKYFIKINNFFFGNGKISSQKIYFKNLTKITKNIFLEPNNQYIEPKKEKRSILIFLCV
jgi:hypothetical protein